MYGLVLCLGLVIIHNPATSISVFPCLLMARNLSVLIALCKNRKQGQEIKALRP